MINDCLPRYYETHGDDPKFSILQTFVVLSHEVAWMEYIGSVLCDITDRSREGEKYVGRELYCECDFKEGVGWQIDPEHGVVSIGEPQKCRHRKSVVRRRHKELRKEFLRQFKRPIKNHIPEIILALIEKVKTGEFIEDGSGASFWGGYFYLQTVASITKQSMSDIWKIAEGMIAEKKISLEGAVVTPYRKSPRAKWVESFRFQIDKNGWTVIASIPAHRQMKQVWNFKIVRADGKKIRHNIPELTLVFDPDFGPDVEDVARAEKVLNDYLAITLWKML
ncbi:MAG: hypothetical protein HY225_02955 [Candidatus Vogelbacteria bacterium]|nr:hypothetical protein [Candidatus Vogelbacteria bacterium]